MTNHRDEGELLLHAEDVGVEIDGAELLPATSIALRSARAVAVRGPNGAGKTTLLRVLAGRLRPSAGSAQLFGAPLDERSAVVRGHVAALIEPPTLYPDLTLRDHIALISAAWSRPAADTGSAPRWVGLGTAALERFGIAALADRFPNELSSGQRQLVSLAVTLARPCSVLLLDEPEQRLDPDRRDLVAEVLGAARAAGVALAFASHDPVLVSRVADTEVVVGAAGVAGAAGAAGAPGAG
ncbi:ABC transporter ATP-binding protein [Leucobacter chromiireducens]|uniref:ABC transporter ATP-binding protein n=1 Tax=Leucobacter chromiireducens TaxID=283877 RepID=UPI000F63385F|nr:ATP-binding cassette domain-containing protein [Leucobacter chromiireducens]